MRKTLQPERRIPPGKPVIKCNQLRVLPPRLHQMHQPSQLFKAEQKKQMRIPVPPKMPELMRQSRTDTPVCPCPLSLTNPLAFKNTSLSSAQNQNNQSQQSLHPNHPHRR